MAAQTAEENVAPAGGTTASSGGGGRLVTVLTIVNLLATAGMIAVLVISFQRDKQAASVADLAPNAEENAQAQGAAGAPAGDAAGKTGGEFGKMVTLEQFTVNLSTPGSVNPKYVRVAISLSVPNIDTESEVTAKMPQVRNAVIDLFNSKRPADLSTAEGRDYLKEEIRNALNGFLVNGKVKGVFFTSFAVSG